MVLIPSATPVSGPHEYVKFVRGLGEDSDALTLPLSGFIEGEPLPTSISVVAQTLAGSILRNGIDTDFALVAHSSGGWFAQAAATHLESVGVSPAAVVLLDTYWPGSKALEEVFPRFVFEAAETALAGIDDTRLTAMAAYFQMIEEWRPAEIAAPTILVRASQPYGKTSPEATDSWQASWELPHLLIDVPGDHMSMMAEHASSTAKAVLDALRESVLSAQAGEQT
jgi:thioesterase domain-containing protein